jgi:xanthine dehydrogenase YagS FAD-binding subunit
MRAFEYVSATSVDEAIGCLDERHREDGLVRPLAGGTDLLPMMKAAVAQPHRLVDIKQLGLLRGEIVEDTDGLRLGALTSLSAIESHPLVRTRYTALAEAAGSAATPQLRNMATLGGNLLQRPRCWYFRSPLFQCWLKGGDECQAREGENELHAVLGESPCVAVHPSDPPAALLALDASVTLAGPTGERRLPLSEFFVEPTDAHRLENVLGPDELVLSVHVPRPAEGTRGTYFKAMNRKVWAFALSGVAAVVCLEGSRIADARLVLSGVAPIPWRSQAAESVLIGSPAEASVFERAAEAALADAHPLQNNGYKLQLTRSLIRQALHAVTASA